MAAKALNVQTLLSRAIEVIEVVEAHKLPRCVGDQALDEVTSDEACPTGDEHCHSCPQRLLAASLKRGRFYHSVWTSVQLGENILLGVGWILPSAVEAWHMKAYRHDRLNRESRRANGHETSVICSDSTVVKND